MQNNELQTFQNLSLKITNSLCPKNRPLSSFGAKVSYDEIRTEILSAELSEGSVLVLMKQLEALFFMCEELLIHVNYNADLDEAFDDFLIKKKKLKNKAIHGDEPNTKKLMLTNWRKKYVKNV